MSEPMPTRGEEAKALRCAADLVEAYTNGYADNRDSHGNDTMTKANLAAMLREEADSLAALAAPGDAGLQGGFSFDEAEQLFEKVRGALGHFTNDHADNEDVLRIITTVTDAYAGKGLSSVDAGREREEAGYWPRLISDAFGEYLHRGALLDMAAGFSRADNPYRDDTYAAWLRRVAAMSYAELDAIAARLAYGAVRTDAVEASTECACGHPYVAHDGGGNCEELVHVMSRQFCSCAEFRLPPLPGGADVAR